MTLLPDGNGSPQSPGASFFPVSQCRGRTSRSSPASSSELALLTDALVLPNRFRSIRVNLRNLLGRERPYCRGVLRFNPEQVLAAALAAEDFDIVGVNGIGGHCVWNTSGQGRTRPLAGSITVTHARCNQNPA